jgi:hypothetical protein
MVVSAQPGARAVVGHYETCGGPRPGLSYGGRGGGPGVAGHVVAPDLALPKQVIPAVADLVLMFALSWYLGVPVPRGTDTPLGVTSNP